MNIKRGHFQQQRKTIKYCTWTLTMVEMVNFIIYILYNKKIKILYLEFKLIKQKNNTCMKKTLKHYLEKRRKVEQMERYIIFPK